MMYLSIKFVLIRMFTDNISTAFHATLVRRSSSIIKRLIFPKKMIESFVVEHSVISCSFLISFFHETGWKLHVTEFGWAPVSIKQLVLYNTFSSTPTDAYMQ